MTRGQLYDLANTQVGQRISILSGVSQVHVYGTKTRDPHQGRSRRRWRARDMTMDDLADAIREGTSYQGAGQFDGPNRTFLLQPQGQLDDRRGVQQPDHRARRTARRST